MKKSYPLKQLYEEMAFIGYYIHWPHAEIMALDHAERTRWCSEISDINKAFNEDAGKKNIFDIEV